MPRIYTTETDVIISLGQIETNQFWHIPTTNIGNPSGSSDLFQHIIFSSGDFSGNEQQAVL